MSNLEDISKEKLYVVISYSKIGDYKGIITNSDKRKKIAVFPEMPYTMNHIKKTLRFLKSNFGENYYEKLSSVSYYVGQQYKIKYSTKLMKVLVKGDTNKLTVFCCGCDEMEKFFFLRKRKIVYIPILCGGSSLSDVVEVILGLKEDPLLQLIL